MAHHYTQLALFDPIPPDMAVDELMDAKGRATMLARKLKEVETMAVRLADYFHSQGWPGGRALDEAADAIGTARAIVVQLEEFYKWPVGGKNAKDH